ncbi:hypothetical protein NDU88_006984 [Pleurodeles waltl]|uniref:Uncharacterized protein n=1 Tax=Pleurodeles waltl TaxID=8319 RepID=A0AAV7WF44_PLEWA|nr:hypothetical protein NDU88_006984 [Pleurodeles waltl]
MRGGGTKHPHRISRSPMKNKGRTPRRSGLSPQEEGARSRHHERETPKPKETRRRQPGWKTEPEIKTEKETTPPRPRRVVALQDPARERAERRNQETTTT